MGFHDKIETGLELVGLAPPTGPTTSPYFDRVLSQFNNWTRHEQAASRLVQEALTLAEPGTHDATRFQSFASSASIIIAGADGATDALEALQGGGTAAARQAALGTVMNALQGQVEFAQEQQNRLADQLWDIDPDRAASLLPYATDYIRDQLTSRGGGGTVFQPTFEVLPDGTILAFDPNSLSVIELGNHPGAVNRQVSVDKNGNLVSINPFDPTEAPQTIIKGFQFPSLDPNLEFAVNTRLQLEGLRLEDRAQQIQALSNDFAFQIELGNMTFTDAQVRLARINSALDQRRAEREQALEFAVPKSSIRTLADGTRVSAIPGFLQLRSILRQATGQTFGEEFGTLPVGTIDPDAAARTVLAASSFESPVPALQKGLQSTRDAINSLLGQGSDKALADVAAMMVAGGISGA